MDGQNRVEHLVDFPKGLFLVKLPEGLIGHGVVQIRASYWQPVSSNPATGNQAMFVAATPDDQIGLEKGVHKEKQRGRLKADQLSASRLKPI